MENKNELMSIKNGTYLPTVVVDEQTIRDFLFSTGTAEKLSIEQQNLFLMTAKAFNLNPVKREVYCIPFKVKSTEKDEAGKDIAKYDMSIVVGYETYLKRAEELELLDGWNVEVFGKINKVDIEVEYWNKYKKDTGGKGGYDKKLQTVWRSEEADPYRATISIYRKDRSRVFTWTVLFDEYTQDNSMWFEKPFTMLKKVAIAQGFRLCFPREMGGLPYIAEEVKPSKEEVVIESEKKENPFMPKKKSDTVDAEFKDKHQANENTPVNTETQTATESEIKAKRKILSRLIKEASLDAEKFITDFQSEIKKKVEEFTSEDWETAINVVKKYISEKE